MYTIYVIIDWTNNKMYVGQAQNLRARWSRHKSAAKNGTNHPLYNAMRKHGIENFTCEPLLEVETQEDADYQEHIWIVLLRANRSQDGYVISKDGKGNYNVFPEDLERRSVAFRKALKSKPHCCIVWREDIKTEDILRMYYGEGIPTKEIAKQLGCSKDTVLDRMKWVGQSPGRKWCKSRKRPSPVQKSLDASKVENLYKEGMTPEQVAGVFGCSRKSIFNCLKNNGVKLRSMSEAVKISRSKSVTKV